VGPHALSMARTTLRCPAGRRQPHVAGHTAQNRELFISKQFAFSIFSMTTKYDSGTLGHRRKLMATRECDGEVESVIAALGQLRGQVRPENTVYVASGNASWEGEVVSKLSLVEDTIEDGRVVYYIVLDI
jgi:hypothetical protein